MKIKVGVWCLFSASQHSSCGVSNTSASSLFLHKTKSKLRSFSLYWFVSRWFPFCYYSTRMYYSRNHWVVIHIVLCDTARYRRSLLLRRLFYCLEFNRIVYRNTSKYTLPPVFRAFNVSCLSVLSIEKFERLINSLSLSLGSSQVSCTITTFAKVVHKKWLKWAILVLMPDELFETSLRIFQE